MTKNSNRFIYKKIIALSFAVVILIAAIYAYKAFNRKPADMAAMKSAATVNAIALINAFEKDESNANELYLGKIIEVNGTVVGVVNQADTLVNILLGSQEMTGKVSCLVDNKYLNKASHLQTGSSCIVKGVCVGYLMDVELNRCIIR